MFHLFSFWYFSSHPQNVSHSRLFSRSSFSTSPSVRIIGKYCCNLFFIFTSSLFRILLTIHYPYRLPHKSEKQLLLSLLLLKRCHKQSKICSNLLPSKFIFHWQQYLSSLNRSSSRIRDVISNCNVFIVHNSIFLFIKCG